MAETRPSYTREDSALESMSVLPEVSTDERSSSEDEKACHDGKNNHLAREVSANDPIDYINAEGNFLANGKERPIESANDIATRCISLEDDPTLEVGDFHQFRVDWRARS